MPTTTTTTALKFLPERWTPGLLQETTEEEVVGKNFSRPPGGVKKIGQKLHIPKMLAISAQSGAGPYSTSLTYSSNTEEEVTVSPEQSYAAVEIQRSVYLRMDINPDGPYRQMLKYALAEYRDVTCAGLADNLATNVKGSAIASMDKGLLLDAQQALAISAKRRFKPGETLWYIKVHPLQLKNCMGVFDLTADYVRGDAVRPLVSGWMSPVLGANIDESGNVLNTGGIIHNLAYIPEAFVIGFNEESTVLEPQPVELVVRIIATEEFGASEQFDEYAVDMQTGQS